MASVTGTDYKWPRTLPLKVLPPQPPLRVPRVFCSETESRACRDSEHDCSGDKRSAGYAKCGKVNDSAKGSVERISYDDEDDCPRMSRREYTAKHRSDEKRKKRVRDYRRRFKSTVQLGFNNDDTKIQGYTDPFPFSNTIDKEYVFPIKYKFQGKIPTGCNCCKI